MLNIEVNRSAEGVERYFDRELALSDYLMKEPGVWAGRGAERLGLPGTVRRTQFVALFRNEDPTGGKRLTARMNTSRWLVRHRLECIIGDRRLAATGKTPAMAN